MMRNARMRRAAVGISVGVLGLAMLLPVTRQAVAAVYGQVKDTLGYQDTPMLPGGKWHVHDGFRPQPPVITPGTSSTPDAPGKAPSDATVLFDGTSESLMKNWEMLDKHDAPVWTVVDGAMIPKRAYITTKQNFGDCQLHVEWRTPSPGKGSGQGRGNSGVFLMGQYEIQVLDNFGNQTYPDGQAGSIYGQYPPLVNASLAPGVWQTYDIIWTAPVFNADKTVASPAYATILHNGVVVQNHQALLGKTDHRTLGSYHFHDPTGPLQLQFHGDETSFRNIWIRPVAPAAL